MLRRQREPNRALLAIFLLSFSIASIGVGAPKKHNTLPHKTPSKPASESKATPEQAPLVKGFASKIESMTRQVEVRKGTDANWKKAKSQMSLSSSDQIKTGTRSVARVKLGDGSKVLLLQNSQAEMENLSSVQKTIKLLRGRVRAIVAKIKGGNNFQIKTPVGVASVRGTDFEVEVSDDGQQMSIDVREGHVGVSRLGDLAGEVMINAGERIKFGLEGEIGDPIRSGALPMDSDEVRSEVQIARTKENIVAMAAEESRNADYQVGKSLIDVNGQRVRVEEYITRPQSDQFKLVVLNERTTRFDYFTYKGTFNQALPEDLSVALKQVGGKLGSTSPDYYLTNYETLMSNTIDSITDSASGGHLVKITFDGSNYTLIDNADATHTRTIEAAVMQIDDQGNVSYKIYNPIRDAFSTVTAANKDEAVKISVLDTVTGSYHNLTSGDIYWKTRFDNYSSFVNTTAKTAFAVKPASVHTLAIDLDATFTNKPITIISEFPSGTSNLHNKLSLYYSDGSNTTYDNYIIDDLGAVAPTSSFEGKSTSAAYKEELEKWNYETRVEANEMNGRYIDLVVDPRIGTISGLIQ